VEDAVGTRPKYGAQVGFLVAAQSCDERFGDVPDMTLEEHQRRGDAADTLFREIVRRATE
jgi:hypothetical protein